ncbi:MAG: hypothetical protein HKUEN01_34060 [Candidatus Kuenenia stuttgartiensis]|uniref:hypothetical protein n=1 Tax=Kuenenia stuttgartiensis TaxID=174633 RepID=UPI00146A391A|nr:hypothetical protein [Candidatus Kuenenia stuttgartiensis]GJQ51020.1 MAG: hypothetical protein HKUEN01_34060 [Candidatus Kuenenia stuttgartiensis]
MPRIPMGLVDGFVYHAARKGRKVACPLPPLIIYPIGVIDDAKACLKNVFGKKSEEVEICTA